MGYKKIVDLMDSFAELNDGLELCRGYAQSETPNMKALENVLCSLQLKYREIYEQLRFFCERGVPTMNYNVIGHVKRADGQIVPLVDIAVMTDQRWNELAEQQAVHNFTKINGHAPESAKAALERQREWIKGLLEKEVSA